MCVCVVRVGGGCGHRKLGGQDESSAQKSPAWGNQATKLARVLKATWLARDMATIVAYPKKAGPVEASRGEK